MSAKQQGVQPQGQELTTDGQTIHSSAPGAPGAMDPNLGGSRTPAVTGVPQGTPAVEPQGYAKLATAPGAVFTGYGVGSKVGVADPDDTRLPASATGAAFGLAEGSAPAGRDAYAEPGARLANRPDDVSRGAPEQAIGQEREGAAGAKGGDT